MIVAAITLFIAFFLLLIAMTQNINEAVWEYGVLRSMGFTKDEGRRLYMYEGFTIVIVALFLGIIVGLITSLLITSQFLMFIEMPFSLEPPYMTMSFLVLVSSVTTYISVRSPIE